MLQLIPASMAERFISVCIKNLVRAYLAAILKNDAAKSFCKQQSRIKQLLENL